MEFCSMDVFRAIRKFVGTFLDVDGSFQHTGAYLIACILVKAYLREGLIDEIILMVQGKTYNQIIDYVLVPLSCSFCPSLDILSVFVHPVLKIRYRDERILKLTFQCKNLLKTCKRMRES